MKKNVIARELKTQATILGTFVAIFWVVEIIDRFIFHDSLDQLGIKTGSFAGLIGIFFAPFLHGGFPHLIANTIPFLVLGWFVMLQETSDFFIVTLLATLVGGLGVWLFGSLGVWLFDARISVHLGSSILIFGYLGFLLLRGYFQRNLPSIVLSIAVGLTYGGLIWGVLPTDPRISWQGHLFGFLGGVLAAKMIAKEKLREFI
jgi:membrane associated rhomboid family serine protease